MFGKNHVHATLFTINTVAILIESQCNTKRHRLNSHTKKSNTTNLTMQLAVIKLASVFIIALIIAITMSATDATYRKPPFNGSIFGKRGTTSEYESASKAISAMCEIATEACQTWFPNQDK